MSPEPRRHDVPTVVMRLTPHAFPALQNVPRTVLDHPDRLLHFLKHVQEVGWEDESRPMMVDFIPVLRQADASDELWLQLIFSEMSLRGFYGDPFAADDYLEAFPHLHEQLHAWFPAKSTVQQSGAALRQTPLSRLPASSILGSLSRNPDYPEIPGYEVQDVIGRGGMGIVFRARQIGLDRIVALKVIVSGYNSRDDDRTRFRLEAEAVGRVRHPNIVQVFGCGEHKGVPWLALEYVPGGTLGQLTREQPQEVRFAAALVETLAHAVGAAHRCSVIHRDLKPANILLEVYPPEESGIPVGARLADGRQIVPRITDFGLALRTDREQLHLTSQGVIAGTPGYMAPEQIAVGERRSVGPHSDIWALGVMLYELLTGQLPFAGVSSYDTVEKVVRGDPARPRALRPQIPRDLEIVCLKCLEKSPALRYASAGELAADLRRFLDGQSILARPVGPVGSAARWVRRNPSTAAMLVTLVGSLAFWTATSLHQTSKAKEETRLIAAQAGEIEEQKHDAQRMARDAERLVVETERQKAEIQRQVERRTRELYAARMMNAHRAWEMGQLGRTREILEDYEPLRPDAPDYRGFEWHQLRLRTQSESHTFPTATPAVGVAFSPDADRVALAERACVRIVRASDRRELLRIDGLEGSATAVAWSPTGERLLVGDSLGAISLYDTRDGRLLRTPRQLNGPIGKLDFSPDGRHWAAYANPEAADGSEILVCETAGGDGQTFRPAIGRVGDLSFGSPDRVAVVSADRFLWVKKLGSPGAVRTQLPAVASSVALSPVSERVALGWISGRVSLYDPTTRRDVWQNANSVGRVTAMHWSPDGRYLLTGGVEPILRLRSGASGEPTRTFRGHSAPVLAVRFSPDPESTAIASASEDRSVRLWNTDSGASESNLRAPERPVRVFPLEGDDSLCLMANGSVSRVAPVEKKVVPVCVSATPGDVLDGCLLFDRSAVVSINGESEVVRTDLKTGTVTLLHLPGVRSRPTRVACSASRLALGFEDGSIGVWAVDSPALPTILSSHELAVDSLDFSPDGALLISGGRDGRVRVVDVASGRLRSSQKLHPGRVGVVRFSPTGRWFASGGDDSRIHLRRVADGSPVCEAMAHTACIRDLIFTPDEKRVVSCGDDLTVRVWDPGTGQEVMTLRAQAHCTSLAFSPTTNRLTACGGRVMIRSWAADISPRSEELIDCLAHIDIRLTDVPPSVAGGSRVEAGVRLKTSTTRVRPLSAEAEEDWRKTIRIVATLEPESAEGPDGGRTAGDDPIAARVEVGRCIPARAPDFGDPQVTIPIALNVPEVPPGRYRLRVELIRREEVSRVIATHSVPVVVPAVRVSE